MREIEIDFKPKVFDDPEYCNSDTERCEYLEMKVQCSLFKSLLGFGPNPDRNFKCDQCKEAYQRAKNPKYPEFLERRKEIQCCLKDLDKADKRAKEKEFICE